jgi:hypothetical protein
MGFAGFGRTGIAYQMFDLQRSAEEARRMSKCERIYHAGQELAWDGRDLLPELLAKHGGVQLADDKRRALMRIFAIILWGELAAWRISAQLADRLEPLEAKMAATSQAHDEARHFYVMHDYLRELGYRPTRLDRAPQALLDLVLDTDHLAHKLLGMQLQVETLALTLFQAVREAAPEPVITELMRYYERDEARHVGLGMQYLPVLMKDMGRLSVARLMAFQARVLFWAMWEAKVLEPDLRTLGLEVRPLVERAREKQLAALNEAFKAIGLDPDRARTAPMIALTAAVELLFPTKDTRGSTRGRLRAAWQAMAAPLQEYGIDVFDVHARHAIRTARGVVAAGEKASA